MTVVFGSDVGVQPDNPGPAVVFPTPSPIQLGLHQLGEGVGICIAVVPEELVHERYMLGALLVRALGTGTSGWVA